MLVDPDRGKLRDYYFATWQKYQSQQPLTPFETVLVGIIAAHPEYHVLLNQPEKYRDKDYLPEFGDTNPFLHMSLHMALAEQVSTDRPTGIAAVKTALIKQYGSEHAAEHAMIECLAETLWQAERHQQVPDEMQYLQALRAIKKH
jgi:hypothetical protein